MTVRHLTRGERALAASIFTASIDYEPVTVRRRKWFPLQPRNALMAPTGHIFAHPRSDLWSEDYSREAIGMQALFVHEMTHVWQAQTRGKLYLPLMRHPFCRYCYSLRPGWRFGDYGIEQQAEIVRHLFLLREGRTAPGAPAIEELERLIPFGG